MYVPFETTRYFTQGTNHALLLETPFYTEDEYSNVFQLLSSNVPEMFSINLREQIVQYGTTIPPQFNVSIHEVIDLACYYYSDWDCIRAVTDEFVDDQALALLRSQLSKSYSEPKALEAALQFHIEMLSEAVRDIINVVIGVLCRFNVAAVEDFGSIYRLTNIDDTGNVFFQIQSPDVVSAHIQENVKLNKLARPLYEDLVHERSNFL